MLPKTMRLLEVNVCILLVAFLVIHASTTVSPGSILPGEKSESSSDGGSSDEGSSDGGSSGVNCRSNKLFEMDQTDPKNNSSRPFLNLMKERFDLSMKYLLTSKQFGSQYVQRPGMAKYLDEASSRQWEEGMDLLKKFLQRGGSTMDQNFKFSFNVEGNPQLSFSIGEDISTKYVSILKDMLRDSKGVAKRMNHIHRLGGKIKNGGDAEILHYLDDKLEKEAEISRELAGHVNTLLKMRGIGVALNMFDSNL